MNPLLVKIDGFATLIGVSRSHLFAMISAQRVPLKSVRFGRCRLFKVSDIEEWVQAGCPAKL